MALYFDALRVNDLALCWTADAMFLPIHSAISLDRGVFMIDVVTLLDGDVMVWLVTTRSA